VSYMGLRRMGECDDSHCEEVAAMQLRHRRFGSSISQELELNVAEVGRVHDSRWRSEWERHMTDNCPRDI
jgi:hypothetical protein